MRIWLGICVTCLLAVGLAPLAAQDVAGVSPETHKLLLDYFGLQPEKKPISGARSLKSATRGFRTSI